MTAPLPLVSSFALDVRAGLTSSPKTLAPQYFYDAVGSVLFEAITLLDEYGLTRADESILAKCAADIAARAGAPLRVAELGSGTGRKTRRLLEHTARLGPVHYTAIDISAEALHLCSNELSGIGGVEVGVLETSYLAGLETVARGRRETERLLVLFLGSTIGNFDRDESAAFLAGIRALLERGDLLLVGADLMKPERVLLAAYDDPAGVTAAFNLNLLARINRELGADFDLRRFRHTVLWKAAEARIEMHLRSTSRQSVSIPGAGITITIEPDETIWTESSHKYTLDGISSLGTRAGFRRVEQWVEDSWGFAETLFEAC